MPNINVQTYPQLLEAERVLLGVEEESQLGRFRQGEEESTRLGQGFEIDGLRDYVDGDDIRHIDWLRSAQRGDGGYCVRQHYSDQAPLTVIVSDIPTEERYARTLGTPLSAQALGFVAAHTMLRTISNQSSEVLAYWTNGVIDDDKSGVVYSGPSARIGVLERGLSSATRSAERYAQLSNLPDQKRRLFGRKKQVENIGLSQETETLSQAIVRASKLALRSSDVARFIILSDFRSDTDETIDELKKLQRFGSSNVVTVQITNPLLRELPDSQDVFSSGSEGLYIESQSQRDTYKHKAQEKQARIDAALKSVSTRTLSLDTMNPLLARVA